MTNAEMEREAFLILRRHGALKDDVLALSVGQAHEAVRTIIRRIRQEERRPIPRVDGMATPWAELGLTPPSPDPGASISDALIAAGILDWAKDPPPPEPAEPAPFVCGWLGPDEESA